MVELYWSRMKGMVKRYVKDCQICQRNKTVTLSPVGLLQPLPIPEQIWEDIAMNFVEGLPRSEGYVSFLVVVERLSKYAHFILLSHLYSTKSVATLFVKEIVRLHGFSRSIVSDCDKIFISHFWVEMFCLQGTQLCRSTAYHPQTNGQTEAVNKCLKTSTLFL